MTDLFILLKNHVMKIVIIVLLVIFSMISMGYVYNNNIETAVAGEEFDHTYIADENGDKYFYSVTEFLNDNDYNEYMRGDSSLYEKIKSLRKALSESKDFNYISLSQQNIEMLGDYFTSEEFFDGYEMDAGENGYNNIKEYNLFAVKTLMPSLNFYDVFSIRLSEGRMFNEGDIITDNEIKQIPVILGSAYKEFYKTGDVFKGYYSVLDEDVQTVYDFKIIGFLDDKQFFYNNNSFEYDPFTSCERYVFMPPVDLKYDSISARLTNLTQIYGILESNKNSDETEKLFNDIIKDCGLEEYGQSIYIYGNRQSVNEIIEDVNVYEQEEYKKSLQNVPVLKQYSSMTHSIARQFKIMAYIILFFCIIVISLLMIGILKVSFYKFGVMLLCGASKANIYRLSILLVSMPMLAGSLIASAALLIMGATLVTLMIVQIIFAAVVFLSCLICILYLKKYEVHEIISVM